MPPRISSFQDWTDLFHLWLDDIGYARNLIQRFDLGVRFADLPDDPILFGGYRGQRRWERVIDVPDQRIRDTLLHLIVYQGDTEFASVEQQRNLIATAPTDYDRETLLRVNAEEMRHGWQMCALMIEHFGETGRVEAQKQLERRAGNRTRLSGSFNEPIEDWLDLFAYFDFIDRDGKFQLTMLSFSAFTPLARSVRYMLKEEQFHLGSGQNGMLRIVRAGKILQPVVQRCVNRWVSTGFDLFGTDESSSAEWAYEWGLKGRVDEDRCCTSPDRATLNDLARQHYDREVQGLIAQLNHAAPPGWGALTVPDPRFHRSIGR